VSGYADSEYNVATLYYTRTGDTPMMAVIWAQQPGAAVGGAYTARTVISTINNGGNDWLSQWDMGLLPNTGQTMRAYIILTNAAGSVQSSTASWTVQFGG